ncbi:DUF2637 domain-containing protein [Nocardiopsis sp. NPDC049922]|uniref:DUF2637 domain-containing protein n=1 Tax=Nocardiopsis sp. NPDC049922 TaxID=3155157 RepID=UPI0033E4DC8D
MAMAPYDKAPETGTRNGRPASRGPGAGALVGGALFVGVIAVCALVISYAGVFRFAEYGGHEGSPLAHVFPVTYTLLLLMAFWVSYVLREAHPRDRAWVDLALIPVLIAVAAGAMVLSNLGLVESVHQGVANVIVAVAPLAALLVAFLLWMTVRAHIRRRRRGAPVRPRPSADRATVLHGRAVAPSELDDDHHLTTRLLDFGPAPVRRGHGADAPEDPFAPDTATRPLWRDEPEADDDEGSEVVSVTPVASRPESTTASVTAPLPRRTRTGANPIKRASTDVPVVPGAAAPVDPPGDEADDDGLAGDVEDGFEDEPLPGDPATDEADAPTAPVAGEPREPEPEPDPVAPAPPEQDTRAFDAPEPSAEPEDSPIPDTALWEPPADTPAEAALADYVPPVWTPPEDEDPEALAVADAPEADEAPTPVLDHDTGPEVRAAFGIGSVPPGAAAPGPEPEDRYQEPEPGPTDRFHDRDVEDDDTEPVQNTEPPPGEDPAPEPDAPHEPPSRPAAARPGTADADRRPPLEKRPMVLKPRRPPMPDPTPGPPSGRVRSEPLPPRD